MKTLKFKLIAIGLLAGAFHLSASAASASIQVSQGWVRWLPSGLPAAGYLTIHNNSSQSIDLVQENSPDYRSVMLHQTISKNGTEHMEMISRLPIPAHAAVKISPGGYHFMLINARHSIVPGNSIRISLQFSDGETVDAQLAVRSPSGAN